MLGIARKLLRQFSIEDIESASVQLFVENNSIHTSKNRLVGEILARSSPEITKIKQLLRQADPSFHIYDLVALFELLIPEQDRKVNGAFFTPQTITSYITAKTIQSPDATICDPSCGCGAFLLAAVQHLHVKYGRSIRDIIETNIYGVDLLEYSAKRARILLTLLALQHGDDYPSVKDHIIATDSLTANWHKLFPTPLQAGGFDVVIGNPPYVKFQELPADLRQSLYDNWQTLKTGTYNLYFAFFELGIQILRQSGNLGYITPNNYFTSLSGVHLRQFLADSDLLYRIIDFNHLKVFDAQTYTCITFLRQSKNKYFYYERVEDKNFLSRLSKLSFSKVYTKDLNHRKWRLLRQEERYNIEVIEGTGTSLGNLTDVRVGIATCKDTIYFVDGGTLIEGKYYKKTYKGDDFLIERAITKPIARVSDFATQAELENNLRRIIFPYNVNKGKAHLISETDLQRDYPHCYQYLLAARPELETRDKGQNHYEGWFAYARTQGLSLHGPKLLTPTFSVKPRFLLDRDGESLFCNGYAVFLNNKKQESLFSSTISLDALAKVLNSEVMNYYVSRTSVSIEGGYPCYQKNFIELFGIPLFDQDELDFLAHESDKAKVDRFLVKKYGLEF